MASRRSVEDVKTLLRSCKGFGIEKRMDFYDSWAETYEQDSDTMSYTAPHQAVDFLNENFCGKREEARVLDVACGSGLVAKLMFQKGFRHFVGIDGSRGMLGQAEKTGLYQDLKLAVLGPRPLPVPSGEFDVVVIIGALRDCFVPVDVIRQLWQAAKPGGIICMSRIKLTSQSEERYTASMEAELQRMETESRWTQVASKELKGYMMNVYDETAQEGEGLRYLDGTIYLYRKSF